jgi:hypothetical protein
MRRGPLRVLGAGAPSTTRKTQSACEAAATSPSPDIHSLARGRRGRLRKYLQRRQNHRQRGAQDRAGGDNVTDTSHLRGASRPWLPFDGNPPGEQVGRCHPLASQLYRPHAHGCDGPLVSKIGTDGEGFRPPLSFCEPDGRGGGKPAMPADAYQHAAACRAPRARRHEIASAQTGGAAAPSASTKPALNPTIESRVIEQVRGLTERQARWHREGR